MKAFFVWLLDQIVSLIKYFFHTACDWIVSLVGLLMDTLGVSSTFNNLTEVWVNSPASGFTSLVAKFFPVDDFIICFGIFFTVEALGLVYRIIIKVLRG